MALLFFSLFSLSLSAFSDLGPIITRRCAKFDVFFYPRHLHVFFSFLLFGIPEFALHKSSCCRLQ
ncbi:hypothetical protein J3F84DRAFT_385621 [Trichoderma pleuroticola]